MPRQRWRAFLERAADIDARSGERGHEAEANAGGERGGEGDEEHFEIGAAGDFEGDGGGNGDAGHGRGERIGEQNTAKAAGEREQDAFDKELADDSGAAGADRETDRDFTG